jgi:hypothetical protein
MYSFDCCSLFFSLLKIYSTRFGLTGHLQVYKLVLEGRSYKANATATGSFFGVGTVQSHACVQFHDFVG